MAEDSKKDDAEVSLETHIEFAVQEISANIHLRALFRNFLAMTNVLPQNSVFDLNPVQNAYNQGYQAAGLHLASILTSVDARLVPTLLLEELTQNEQTD